MPPSRVVADLPAAFDRVMTRALTKERGERYSTATELGADLARLELGRGATGWCGHARPARCRGRSRSPSSPARSARHRPAASAHEKQTVVVGGFTNTTGDASFDGSLRLALMVQVQQTPFINVFPRQPACTRHCAGWRVAADEPLTSATAKEIAVRRGIRRWVAVRSRRWVLRVINVIGAIGVIRVIGTSSRWWRHEQPERSDACARTRGGDEQGGGAAGARPDDGALQLRMLGESAPTMQKFSTPIETGDHGVAGRVEAYALGVEQSRHGDYPTAASLFQRAVQIDPDFAMAHMALAREEMNSNYRAW